MNEMQNIENAIDAAAEAVRVSTARLDELTGAKTTGARL